MTQPKKKNEEKITPTFPEPTGDFWQDRESIVRYATEIGLEGERLQQYVALWEGDATRRCDRLYYR